MSDATLHELAELVRSGGSLPDDAVAGYLPGRLALEVCEHQSFPRSPREPDCVCMCLVCQACRALAASEVLRLDAEATLAAVRAYATEERPSIPKCLDPGHDDRWCSHCDSMLDGVGHAQASISRILDGEAPDA